MDSGRKNSDAPKPRRRPATTPEARERQLVALAVDVAEKQLRDGTVSSTVLAQLIKLGTQRERLEQERLRRENLLLEAKVQSIDSSKRSEELYEQAINAMRMYAGQDVTNDHDD